MQSQVQVLRQVEEVAKRPGNNVCAECPERHPAFASLIKPAFRGGEIIGVFICQGCYKHHHSMGMNICEVKSISMATEWSKKELSILNKSGNKMVNNIYEATLDGDDWDNDKEIITFDREEEAKLRVAFVRNKYIKRKYFSEENYHDTMAQLSPSYKRPKSAATGNNKERAVSPRRSSMAGSSVPSTPSRQQQRRASVAGGSPTRDDDKSSDMASLLATPTREQKVRGRRQPETLASVLATPRRGDNGALARNVKETQTPTRRAAAGGVTPRKNGVRRRTSLTGSIHGRRQQQQMFAGAPALDDEILEIAMQDGSQRGQRTRLGGADEEDERPEIRSRERQSALAEGKGKSLSQRNLNAMEKTASERSLLDSSERSTSSRRTNLAELRERSLEGSERGRSSRRRTNLAELRERSLEGSQRGRSSRRSSFAGSDRSNAAHPSEGPRSLLNLEESESESEAERDILKMTPSTPGSLLPSSLQMGGSQLAVATPNMKRNCHSMRTARSSIHEADTRHSMRNTRSSLHVPETEGILDRRRSSMLQANQRLSRRSLIDKTMSERHLVKSPKARRSNVAKSNSTRSMRDDSRSMRDGSMRDDSRSMRDDSRSMRDDSRSMRGSSRRDSGRSNIDYSARSMRESRSMDPSSRSMRESSRMTDGSRSVRSRMDYSGRSRSTDGSRSMRDSRSGDASRRSAHRSVSRSRPSAARKGQSVERSSLLGGKRSGTMKDGSDKSSRSKRSTGMKDGSDPDKKKSTRHSRDGAHRSSDRSRREGKSSRKSSSPSRKLRATTDGMDGSYREDRAKRKKNPETVVHRSRSTGTLAQLRAEAGITDGKPNFDWSKGVSKSAEESECSASSPTSKKGKGSRRSDNSPSRSSRKKMASKSTSPSKRRSTGSCDDDDSDDENVKSKKRSSDPLRKSSDHERKGVKKPGRHGRSNSDVSDGDSEGDDKRVKKRTSRDDKRRSLKKVPSSKKFTRSKSVGKMLGADLEDTVGALDNSKGRAPPRKLKRASQSVRHLGRRDSKTENAEKYKHLDSSVLSSGYTAGTLGLIMTATQSPPKGEKAVGTSVGERLGLAADIESTNTPKRVSQSFDMKSAVGDLMKAGQESMVTQWMTPTEVATTAASLSKSPGKKATSTNNGKKPVSPEMKQSTYNDAMVAQWLAT